MRESRYLHCAATGLLSLYFWGLALATAPTRIGPIDLCLLVAVYTLFAGFLWTLAFAGASLGRIGACLGSLPLALSALWHFREQTWRPVGRLAFLLAIVALTVACTLLAGRLARYRRADFVRATAFAGALAISTLLVASGIYAASETARWVLLRNNRILGTPLFFLLSDPVESIAARVWNSRSDRPPGSERLEPIGHVSGASRYSHPPNIVFVMLDTLRADSLAAYGGAPDLMPNMNRLAERSFLFSDVWANSSWTRPSVGSFFTGLPQELHGAVDRQDMLPLERLTIAEVLRNAGFETVAFVSNFGAVGRDAGFDQGFDRFEEVWDRRAPYARADVVNRAIASWLEARNGSGARRTPLFLYLHYLDPHSPYLSGCDGVCPRATFAEAFDSYRKELRYLDEQLEWVFDDLATALGGPTVLFVTSDHGEEFGEHGEMGHGLSLYRELLHLPAILRTSATRGSRIEGKLEARDFFDLIQRIAVDPNLDVQDWAANRARHERYASVDLTTPSAFHRPYLRRVFMRAFEGNGSLLIWSAYGNTRQLYDVTRDPSQRSNITRTRKAEVESLTARMDELYPRWVERFSAEPTEETLELLRALGYVSD